MIFYHEIKTFEMGKFFMRSSMMNSSRILSLWQIQLICLICLLSCGDIYAGTPASNDPASSTKGVSVDSSSSLSSPNSATSPSGGATSGAAAGTSDSSTEDTKAANTAQSNSIYVTDKDTEDLSKAIEIYNRKYCPPEPSISEINSSVISKLIKLRLIKKEPKSIETLVLRNGRVYRKLKQGQTIDPSKTGENPDSLLGTLDAAVEALKSDSVRGLGNLPPSEKVLLEERRAQIRNQNGEMVDFKYYVPRIPLNPRPAIRGVKKKAPTDILRKTLLPNKYQPSQGKDGEVMKSSASDTVNLQK